jgi:hypothetical protein
MRHSFTVADLEMYLDEAMPPEEMVRVELALRDDPELAARLAAINGRRDAGVHSLGEIWRRHRLSCPSREQLGSHLLGALPPELDDYIRFHLDTIGCRLCRANLTDLKRRQQEAPEAVETRRRRYFQSSVGRLKK